jgi:hypothetical protein
MNTVEKSIPKKPVVLMISSGVLCALCVVLIAHFHAYLIFIITLILLLEFVIILYAGRKFILSLLRKLAAPSILSALAIMFPILTYAYMRSLLIFVNKIEICLIGFSS